MMKKLDQSIIDIDEKIYKMDAWQMRLALQLIGRGEDLEQAIILTEKEKEVRFGRKKIDE